mmetsp:Transcript_13611/g.27199  ORF Transcript_13611/g.27199 Transcript_13611/m.27199 type:complete len:316 (-) Transcript_13611:795-1742(-)
MFSFSTDNKINFIQIIKNEPKIKLRYFGKLPDPSYFVKKFLWDKKNLLVASSIENDLKIFDINKNKIVAHLNFFPRSVHAFCLGINSDLLVSSDNAIFFWRKKGERKWVNTSQIIMKYQMEKIIFNNLTKTMITFSSAEKKFYIWSINDNGIRFSGKMNIINKIISIESSKKSDSFLWSSATGKIFYFSCQGIFISSFSESTVETGGVYPPITNCLKFYDKNAFFSGGTSKKLNLWDIRVKKKIEVFGGHSGTIVKIGAAEEDVSGYPFIISSDIKGIMKVWDIRNKKEFLTFKLPYKKSFAFGENFSTTANSQN